LATYVTAASHDAPVVGAITSHAGSRHYGGYYLQLGEIHRLDPNFKWPIADECNQEQVNHLYQPSVQYPSPSYLCFIISPCTSRGDSALEPQT
jgi:hypothetical protein